MTSLNFKDITIYFKSNCCNPSTGQGDMPCQSPAPGGVLQQLLHKYGPCPELYAVTVTIGTRKYGKLSSRKQFKELYKSIIGYRKALHALGGYASFTFELTKSGVVHSHGIVYENHASRGLFIKHFEMFGSRNAHEESYKKVIDLNKYIDYMLKEYKINGLSVTHEHEPYFKTLL